MIDVHCHILYGVDDGAADLEESVAMLAAAKKCGIDKIICTPHLHDKNKFDFDMAERAFCELKPHAERLGIELRMGYEVHYLALGDIAVSELPRYKFDGSDILLLEFDDDMLPPMWENAITGIQRSGATVMIAHPERYKPLFNDYDSIERFMDIGCEFQLDAAAFSRGLFSKERRLAFRLIEMDAVHWIASDAHSADDYRHLQKAIDLFGTTALKDGAAIN